MAGTWNSRLDVTEALETDGWEGDADNPLGLLRKNGAVWGVTSGSGDSSLTGPEGWTIDFPSDVPDKYIVGFCKVAAARQS
ncbi:hypothetical protein [Streptomyces javensis]|uniref:Uncharacterized protein n=1 Tax=Streptomyces javensis TaxID=114698 RepID=A0ABS0R2W3_9ACTN|nr:hypothetical protein [Streptomyces javensis]MBI0311638.1 hypothetical protein [Streptomyces javensis]